MVKKRSNKKIIEKTPNSKVEHAYLKFPWQELEEISGHSTPKYVYVNPKDIEQKLEQSPYDEYTFLHTHPVPEKFWFFPVSNTDVRKLSYPSVGDIFELMGDPKRREGVIVTRGTKTGKVYGYLILRKTEKTPVIGENGENDTPVKQYPLYRDPSDTVEDYQKDLEKICEAYHLKYKMVGIAGVKRKKVVIAPALILSLTLGLFFLSSNLTGNVIANLSNKTTSFLGVSLLIIGLVAGFFWMKARKKK